MPEPTAVEQRVRTRHTDPPRVTLRALLWVVFAVALFNSLLIPARQSLSTSGLPIEEIHRRETIMVVVVTSVALLTSLFFFYGPWFADMSRKEWLRKIAGRWLFYLMCFPLWWSIKTLLSGKWDALSFGVVFGIYPGVFLVAMIVQSIRRKRLVSARSPAKSD